MQKALKNQDKCNSIDQSCLTGAQKSKRMQNTLASKSALKTPLPKSVSSARKIDHAAQAEHEAWLAKYGPVEQAIFEARERRRQRHIKYHEDRAWAWGILCEMTEGKCVTWRRDGISISQEIANTIIYPLGMHYFWKFVGAESTRRVDKLRSKLRRPLYYKQENERRQALAAERRKIRTRTTVNACPTKEQILDAWLHVKDSHEATIYFGSLIEDLECYLDNSLRRDENGVIIGRNTGVKGWLRENMLALYWRYTTVMRYKAAAKKLRQIVGLSDPVPAEVIVNKEVASVEGGSDCVKTVAIANSNVVPEVAVVRARAIWCEIKDGVAINPTSLVARLDALVDPKRVEERNMLAEWRERYQNEITVRTKGKWWRKLWFNTSRIFKTE